MTDEVKSSKIWLLWDDKAREPKINMDIDMRLLRNSRNLEGRPLLRLYDWDRPAVSIGYIQKEHIVKDDGYAIVKRPTGGGVVYHDRDLTYSLIIPHGQWICALDRVESYMVIHRAVARCIEMLGLKAILSDGEAGKVDRATMRCFATPTKYDVLCASGSGSSAGKIAGSAQRRTRDGILHQGSILLAPLPCGREDLKSLLKTSFKQEFDVSFEEYSPDVGVVST